MAVSLVKPSNPLQHALKQSPPGARSQRAQAGAWNSLPGLYVALTLSRLPFKWILIDMEHGNISDDTMHLHVQTIAASGVSPIVRIVGHEHWMVKRALDAGAHGIMFPSVETKEQAEAIVQSAKYPSQGTRGAGSFFASHALNHSGIGEYIQRANSETLVIVQIESPRGVTNVEEIASVQGIDCLFVGPADLSLSMGYPAMAFDTEPKVQAAISLVRETANKHGKYTGIYTGDNVSAKRRENEGFELVTLGGDMIAMVANLSRELVAYEGPQ